MSKSLFYAPFVQQFAKLNLLQNKEKDGGR